MLAGHWKSHWGEWNVLIAVLLVSCVVLGYIVKKLTDDEVA